MTLAKWPKLEKPREKLKHLGPTTLSEAELIATLWGTGSTDQNAISLAREMLSYYGSLQALFQASYSSLCSHKGLGLAKYASLQAAKELGNRYLKEPIKHTQIGESSEEIKNYISAELRGHQQEIFACLFFDKNLKFIRFERLFQGSHSQAIIHPREVVRQALALNAAALIVAHNHPSGHVEPSQADQALTEKLAYSLDIVEIQLLDHIIVGANQTLSFCEQGYL